MLSAWRELDTAVRTGEATLDKVYGTSFFERLSANPGLSELFNSAMRQGTALTAQQLLHHYDFGSCRTIADIGGGDGTLLAAVLQAYPGLRGILFDTAEGLALGRPHPRQCGCRRTMRDPRRRLPCGCSRGRRTVRAQKRAPGLGRRPRGHDPCAHTPSHSRRRTAAHHRTGVTRSRRRVAAVHDVPRRPEHVGQHCGRERTRADFEQLCERAGFTLQAVTPLPPPVSISVLEATPH